MEEEPMVTISGLTLRILLSLSLNKYATVWIKIKLALLDIYDRCSVQYSAESRHASISIRTLEVIVQLLSTMLRYSWNRWTHVWPMFFTCTTVTQSRMSCGNWQASIGICLQPCLAFLLCDWSTTIEPQTTYHSLIVCSLLRVRTHAVLATHVW